MDIKLINESSFNIDKMNDKQKFFWNNFFHAAFEHLDANAKYALKTIKAIKFFIEIWDGSYAFFAFSVDENDETINNIAFTCNTEMVNIPDEDFITTASPEEKEKVLNNFINRQYICV